MRIIAAAALATLFAGCAYNPSTKQATAFGGAATVGLQFVRAGAQLGGVLRAQIAVDQAACRYLRYGEVHLGAKAVGKAKISLRKKIEVLMVIEGYAKSLVAATDPALHAELEKASTTLTNEIVNLNTKLTAVSGGAIIASPVLKPIATVLSSVLIDVIELDTRRRLRAIVSKMHPRVVRAKNLILDGDLNAKNSAGKRSANVVYNQSIDADAQYLQRIANRWKAEKSCVLKSVRSRGGDPVAAYQLFRTMDAEYREIRNSLTLFKDHNKLENLLDRIIDAHGKLLMSDDEFETSLTRLQKIIIDLTTVKNAIN